MPWKYLAGHMRKATNKEISADIFRANISAEKLQWLKKITTIMINLNMIFNV
jgi:hypothetical protein